MKISCSRRMGVAAIIAAASLTCAGAALAQPASGAVGGNTTDMTSAGNVNGGGMPQVQHQGDVAYVTGGVGLDESTVLKQAQHDWPLAMRFTGPGADYLSDVHVRIEGNHQLEVLKADARGPYMLVKLPPGHYMVHASYKNDEQTRAVTVSKPGGAQADFHWNMQ